jgi:hypothetical protein
MGLTREPFDALPDAAKKSHGKPGVRLIGSGAVQSIDLGYYSNTKKILAFGHRKAA